jgi:serine/threonine protein kinase
MAPSERYGKYLLMDKIATGGMAELYRAKIIGDRGFEKIVAVKKILPYLAYDDILVNSFINEAKLAALLQHQNIVQIYDYGTMGSSYFIAMELLSGKDLRQTTHKSKQKNLPIDLETALYITARICEGLEYAHTLCDFQGKPLGIIHRDISPPNILITYSGQVKIIDFGIAKARNQSKDTQVGIIKGKVAYMSPEQADGKAIDHRSDIFATGILLYEMLARRRMFNGEDTLQVLSLVREARFEPPENVIANGYSELFEILHRALAKNPDDRYPPAGRCRLILKAC